MKGTALCLLTLSFIAGCASTSMHTPKAVPVTEAMGLDEFQASGSMSLANAATEPDHRKWTESVMAFVVEQLEQRGAEVVEGAPRRLNLELVKARRITAQLLLAPFLMPEGCEVTMRAETGDGYVQEYAVSEGAYAWQKACDKGVTGAVVNMLNDPEIRVYLGLAAKE